MGKNVVKLELYNTYNPVVAMLIRLCGGVNKFLPLSNGEGAVVLASASYKCVEGVHPVRGKLPLLESVIHFVQTASIFPNRGRMIEDISSLYRGRIKVGAIPKGGNPC